MVALAFISGAQSSTNQQQSQSSIKLLSKRDESANYDETSPAASTSLLSSINPWLSACDLAQPNSAPDLQVTYQSQPSINLLTFLMHQYKNSTLIESNENYFFLGNTKQKYSSIFLSPSFPLSLLNFRQMKMTTTKEKRKENSSIHSIQSSHSLVVVVVLLNNSSAKKSIAVKSTRKKSLKEKPQTQANIIILKHKFTHTHTNGEDFLQAILFHCCSIEKFFSGYVSFHFTSLHEVRL